ncbi:membrane protein insertion efficiency factor YidD, partial [Patescibacteria group bacterium]|nr:membrane protein insertion efficiency factor YidD [Patescibacteria group bacterium]
QKRISLRIPLMCRFRPTCSQYAIVAIGKYGVIKGVFKAIWRLLRCNPYNIGSCIDLP